MKDTSVENAEQVLQKLHELINSKQVESIAPEDHKSFQITFNRYDKNTEQFQVIASKIYPKNEDEKVNAIIDLIENNRRIRRRTAKHRSVQLDATRIEPAYCDQNGIAYSNDLLIITNGLSSRENHSISTYVLGLQHGLNTKK